jgi:uncharacterized protein (DUF58 family)
VTASGRLGVYVALGAGGMLAGLLLGRPEPAVVALPFLLAAALGLALARAPEVRVRARLERDRVVEGEHVDVAVEMEAERPVSRLEVLLDVPAGMAAKPLGGQDAAGLAAGASG